MAGRDAHGSPKVLRRIAALLIRSADARFILDDLDELLERDVAGGLGPWRARRMPPVGTTTCALGTSKRQWGSFRPVRRRKQPDEAGVRRRTWIWKMSALDPVFIVSLGLVLLGVAVVVAVAAVRLLRARRRARRRVLERPNSHYTSRLVREGETRHRWHDMALERIHEINREEVVRLLAKVEAAGVEALRPNERTFLDHMATLAGTRSPAEPREQGKPLAPELRHRPA